MHLKKFLLFGLIAAVLPAVAEEAADRKTATSLKYVTHELSTRQNKFNAEQNKAMEYTNAAGTVQKRTVTSDLGSSTSDTSLPMVGGVNTKLDTKQDDIDPVNDHTAVTYTGQPGGIGQKGIYQATGTYAEQSDNLIDAKTFNAALKTGLDNEFKCKEFKPDTDLCWVYSIHNATPDNTILPAGYTQLEYIESTGTQWIDTGINIGTNMQTDVRFGKTENSFSRYGFVIGGAYAYQGLVTRLSANQYYASMYSSNSNYVSWNDITKDVVDCSFNTVGHKAVLDGIEKQLTLISPYPTTGRIGIFNSPTNTGTTNIGIGRVYLFKITNHTTNEILFNGIPAKYGNSIGMYDTVSGNFFSNLGNGDDFIAGPEASNNNLYIPQGQQ